MDLKLINNSQLALTDGYVPVEYIESSGVVNIDTGVGIVMNKNYHSIKATIEVIENNGTDSMIFSAFYTFTSTSVCAFNLFCNGTSVDSFKVQAIYPYNTNLPEVSFSGKTTIEQGKGYITINGIKTTVSTSSSSHTLNLILLKGDVKVRIWNFQVLYNGTPIRDYIPVVSYQEGHFGEACLYDTVNNVYKYSSSTGSFTASTNIYNRITTAFVKDCPNVSGIDLLRRAVNLQRIRCNIGDISGTLEELQHYATLSGYSDNYEEQTKPRIIGNFTINTYHTNEEKNSIDIDGLVLFSDNNYNVDYLLDNNLIAVQTIDEDEEGYNQPIADVLESNGFGHTISSDSSKFFMPKTEAAAITSLAVTLFRGNTDIENFNEFKYWTGLTTITAGTGTAATTVGAFGLCTNLESIELPEGLTTIGAYAFYGDTALNRIVIPSTLTTTGDYCFSACTGLTGGDVYYNGTLQQWMNITFNATNVLGATSPMGQGSHFYINGEELTQLTIPTGTTQIKNKTFHGFKYLTGNLVIPDTVTSIGTSAFCNCSGLTGDVIIPDTVTSIGNCAFRELPNVSNFICNSTVNLKHEHISNLGNGSGICILKGSFITSTGATGITGPRFKKFIVYGNLLSTSAYPVNMSGVIELRLKESIDKRTTYTGKNGYSFSGPPTFLECSDISVSSSTTIYGGTSSFIAFIRKNNIPTATPGLCGVSKMSTIYVGDGTSRANDEAVLALYLADTNWSTYSAKLATWYDYNGEYKWYYITDNLTNCTNTNPDEWPHITRGESYETTIVPDEGMTINSLTVEMLDTDTTSPTYDTYIPQPTSYDSATGIYTISIPSVTGNVVITASAS